MANTTTIPNNKIETQKKHPKSQRIDWGKVAAYTILIVWSFIALIPFFYTISVSLMNLTEATGGAFFPSTPQWGNYIQAWDDANFSLFFWNTVKITLIIVTGQVVFCTMASYAFAMLEFPGKNFIFLLILATLLLPEAITKLFL